MVLEVASFSTENGFKRLKVYQKWQTLKVIGELWSFPITAKLLEHF